MPELVPEHNVLLGDSLSNWLLRLHVLPMILSYAVSLEGEAMKRYRLYFPRQAVVSDLLIAWYNRVLVRHFYSHWFRMLIFINCSRPLPMNRNLQQHFFSSYYHLTIFLLFVVVDDRAIDIAPFGITLLPSIAEPGRRV